MTAIRYDQTDGIAIITLSRPERGNSIDADFFFEIMTALDMAALDAAIRVVLTCAEGKNFCLGADAGNLASFTTRSLDQIYADDFRGKIGVQSPDDAVIGTGIWAQRFFEFPKPLICAVNGVAAGGGMSVAMLHHIRICGTSARFTTSFSKLGIGPELGLSATLPAVIGPQNALDLLLSSRIIGADEAKAIGLVLRVESDEQLQTGAIAYAKQLAQASPLALASIVQAQRQGAIPEFENALKWEWAEQKRLFETADFAEAVQAFLEKRAPIFRSK